ncbi:MAG: glycogen debranching enzyme [Lachnospiraceae bacterium]|nr:glycogen debranching enzyme [Lachnospiraceae bacterium]
MMRIDEFPTHEHNGIRYRIGHALPFGARRTSGGAVNFSINSANAKSCTLVLFHQGEDEPYAEIPFPEDFHIGNNFSMLVFDFDIDKDEYGFRFDGDYVPSQGLLFNKEKVMIDPYSKLVSGNETWGEYTYANSKYKHRSRIMLEDYDWEGDVQLEIPIEDLVIYEMHVRGFTKHESSKVRFPGTYAGIIEKIPYLKGLGINCIELLPVFEFDELEFSQFPGDTRSANFWGYSTVSFFAPKAAYASFGPMGMAADEFKNLVKQLHKNGIEVLLDVVFNHTAEMGDGGRMISYKGIDNPTYYLLNPDGTFCNFSGCGNTMNCNNAIVRNHILDCLRYWVSDYHVDGFRFDEAPILSRDIYGHPMTNPPLLELLAHDPILAKTKLIAEAWDAAGLYQVGSFPAPTRWAEWNGKFRDCVRHFIKSDRGFLDELMSRMQGSPDMYHGKSARSTVNFVTCHDGFTLNDLVSYNEKHNLANGEDNRDGNDCNLSWNCGAEGETDDKEVLSLRSRMIKNAFALLMLSRGTPMFVAGDEFRNSQGGNNNAYCQDNEISWLNWNDLKKNAGNYDFFKKMIRFRKDNPVLRKAAFYSGYNSSGYPEISFHSTNPWDSNFAEGLCFAVLYAEPAKDFGIKKDRFIYAVFNSHWEDHEFKLPVIPAGLVWKKILDSSVDKPYRAEKAENCIKLCGRSMVLLMAE